MLGDAKAAQRPSWATERAVGLQLREMGVAPKLPEMTPDAQKARDIICGLCFVRFDQRWRELMRSSLMAMAAFSGASRMQATFTMPGRQFFSAAG